MSLAQIHEILTHRGSGVRGVPAEEAVATTPGRDLRAPAPELAARLAAQQVGDQLFQGLFSGQVRSLYDQSLGTVGSRAGCGLRIKLKFDAQDQELAQLISVPWEFLWRGETHDFLSLSRLSPVVRYLDVPRPAVPIPLDPPLRVLVVVSSPPGLPPLNIKRERANLEATCRKWKGVEIVVLEGADSAAIRRHLLEKPFHVFHFIGHGGFDQAQGEGVLFFEKPSGQPEPVTGQALATFLKDFKTLGLVFLNACDTARTDSRGLNPFSGVAGALVLGGLPAVVAMQFPISDRAAIAFSAAFYQRLAIGDPVDASVVEGRQAILATTPETHEWGTPVLFVRVPDGTVFQSRQLRKGGGQDTAGRPWPKVLAAVLLVLLLVVSLGIFSLPVFQRWAAGTSQGHVLEIEHEFGSSVNGLRGVLSTAEILPNGRMRLHFRFRNTSSKQVGLGFDYRSTYLADGAGNPYRVLATDATAATATDSLPPGGEIERWMEFPAPLDRARTLSVALAGRGQQEIRFPFFTIALPAYSPELSRSSPSVKPAPGALALAVSRAVATSIAGFKGELRGVELRPDGRMRWSFAFLNGSDHDQQVGFDYSGVYLVDEFGNRYSVLGSDTAGRPGQVYQESLPRALRADHWFDFPAPRNGAKSFKVVLASPGRTGLKFLPFDVRVPYYPERYSLRAQPSAPLARIEKASNTKAAQPPVPPPQKTAQDAPPPTESQEAPVKPAAEPQKSVTHTTGQQKFETSIEGLSGSLVAVEGVGDGRLRWTIDLVNQSGRPVEIGFDAGETYLSDNLGHRYGVLRMDRPGDVFRDSLPAGARAVHWFDFPAPANGARRFFVVLASHSSQALRFVPFEVPLPGPEM